MDDFRIEQKKIARIASLNWLKLKRNRDKVYGCPCCRKWELPLIKKLGRRGARRELKKQLREMSMD